MFMKGVVEELLFFLRGETDSKLMEAKGVNIWKGNTERKFLDSLGMKERKEGLMGPMYGYQWRFYGAKYDEITGKPLEAGVDQLRLIVDTIRKDPGSRRILMTDFNPFQAIQGVLYPCHSIVLQFYVDDGFLDMFCYNRSQDLFLGVPFNIASSALLLTIVAKVTGLVARNLHMSLGDIHIYKEHYDVVAEQLTRHRYCFPSLIITRECKEIEDIEKLCYEDFKIEKYMFNPPIKAGMIA